MPLENLESLQHNDKPKQQLTMPYKIKNTLAVSTNWKTLSN